MAESRGIRIGNQTSFSALTVTEPFEYAVANGFDAFEWFPDKRDSGLGWTEQDLSEEMRRRIRVTALTCDIRLSVHAPLLANPFEQENGRLRETLRFLQDIGASLLNIHFSDNEGIEAYAQAVKPLIKSLAEIDVRLSIENTPASRPEDFNRLFECLRAIMPHSTLHTGMCLDVGHANLCQETHNNYLSFIDRLDREVPLMHIHMHENYGDYDSHLTLFTGPSGQDPSGIKGFVERLRDRAFSGSIILEQWPYPASLLRDAREGLLRILRDRTSTEESPDPSS